MHVGAAEVVITPPLGVEIAGYGPMRELRSTEVHRDLMAQALVIRDGSREIALVACDVMVVTSDFVESVRSAVERSTGIPRRQVIVAATHSHSSPSTGGMADFGRSDRQYLRILARTIAGAVSWAQRRSEPARLFVGRGVYDRLPWNRSGTSTVDPSVRTVHALSERGTILAVLGQYACHPVILGPGTVLSPDFPGAFRAAVRRAQPDAVALFVNGACGDIDPITNRDVWGQGTVADVERLGSELAAAALVAMEGARPIESPGLDVVHARMRLDYAVPAPDELERRIALHAAAKRARRGRPDDAFGAPAAGEGAMHGFWLRHYRRLARRLHEPGFVDHELVELQALRIGADTVLVAIPAEVYAEHGLQIEAESDFIDTITICYANGCCGYLPPEREFQNGGYTATLAAAAYGRPPFRADVAEVLVRDVRELLKAAHQSPPGRQAT